MRQRKRAIILPKKDCRDSENEFFFAGEFAKKIEKFEKSYPDAPARDYEASRPIFIAGRKEIEAALCVTPIEESKQEHVELVKDLSKMYKYLDLLGVRSSNEGGRQNPGILNRKQNH